MFALDGVLLVVVEEGEEDEHLVDRFLRQGPAKERGGPGHVDFQRVEENLLYQLHREPLEPGSRFKWDLCLGTRRSRFPLFEFGGGQHWAASPSSFAWSPSISW